MPVDGGHLVKQHSFIPDNSQRCSSTVALFLTTQSGTLIFLVVAPMYNPSLLNSTADNSSPHARIHWKKLARCTEHVLSTLHLSIFLKKSSRHKVSTSQLTCHTPVERCFYILLSHITRVFVRSHRCGQSLIINMSCLELMRTSHRNQTRGFRKDVRGEGGTTKEKFRLLVTP